MIEPFIMTFMGQYGFPYGVIATFVVMLLTGRIVPIAQVNRMIAELAKYSETITKQLETIQLLTKANQELVEQGRTTIKMVKSLPQLDIPESEDKQENENGH